MRETLHTSAFLREHCTRDRKVGRSALEEAFSDKKVSDFRAEVYSWLTLSLAVCLGLKVQV